MKKVRVIKTALIALRRNILRAMLTTLGIMIGIAAVIAMVEIGQGSARALQKTIASMGTNTLIVQSGAAASGGVTFGSGSTLTLTPQDAEAIRNEVQTITAVAPMVRARGAQVVFGNKNWVPSNIHGTTPSYLDIQNWSIEDGEMFTEQDVRNASKVCVIGKTLVKELFQGTSPVGKNLRLQNVSLKIVGVLGQKGSNMMGMDQDDVLIAPWTTIKSRISGVTTSSASSGSVSSSEESTNNSLYPTSQLSFYPTNTTKAADAPSPTRVTNVDQIIVSVLSPEAIPIAINEITILLKDRHRIRPGEEDDFNIRDMSQMIKTMSSTSTMMTNLLLCVAMISLLVGGVGIMNIMLVSVTERTKEIGLRMAVGARGRDILSQFLVEAVILCLLGGIIGIAIGRLCSYLITSFLNWPTTASIPAIVGAVVVSITIGIAFGFYPAWKAAHMDPIEALRYE